MALKAGYKGIKNNLLNKLKAMPFISEIGDGLTLEDGELSATGGGGGGADLSVIAPTFSAETAYTAGEYVTYESKLYKFTTDHAAGAWDVSDVTEVTVSDDLEKTYKSDDATESAIADADYVPFYDSSASASRKSTWSNFKNKILSGVAMISAIGTNETGTTASRAYAVAEHFYKDGKFCTAIASIAQGATFTLNTNYVEGNIAEYTEYKDIINNVHLVNGYTAYGMLAYVKKVKNDLYMLHLEADINGTNGSTLQPDFLYIEGYKFALKNIFSDAVPRIFIWFRNASGDKLVLGYGSNTASDVGVPAFTALNLAYNKADNPDATRLYLSIDTLVSPV